MGSEMCIRDSCGALYFAGWRRFTYAPSDQPPKALNGSSVTSLGAFYQTIQGFPAVPVAGLPSEATNELPHLGDFVIDIDRESIELAGQDALTVYEYLDQLAPHQVRLYFSGSKGFHIIVPWQALGAVPDKNLTVAYYRRIASIVHQETTVLPDYKIYSPSRMLRMPDSWHPKTGLYKVEILPEELHNCAEIAKAPRGPVNTTPPTLAPDMHELYLEAREQAEDTFKSIGDSNEDIEVKFSPDTTCLLYTSPSPGDLSTSRRPSSA